MKIKKKISYKRYSLLSSNLVNLISFKTLFNEQITLNCLKSFEVRLKQILKIIFKFHKVQKKIVFIGFPDYNPCNFLRLFDKAGHSYLNKKNWINGLFTNTNSIFYYLKSKKLFKILKKKNILFLQKLNNLENKPDLIVLYKETDNLELIKEAIKLKIPIICFLKNKESSIKNNTMIYYGFYSELIIHQYSLLKLFYLLLSSILLRNLKLLNNKNL